MIGDVRRQRHWAAGIKFLDTLRKEALSVPERPHRMLFVVTIRAVTMAQKWEQGLGLLKVMLELELRPNEFVYNAAVSAADAGSEWMVACGLLADMLGTGLELDAFSCSAALRATSEGDAWESAVALVAQNNKHLQRRSVTLSNVVISVAKKSQQWAWAEDALTKMQADSFRPDVVTLSSLLTVCEKALLGTWTSMVFQSTICKHRARRDCAKRNAEHC